jgi:type 1 glutamine amidotransferase
VLVLKGGGGPGAFSRSLPQTVEVEAGFAASALHFLGGIAGWGYPWGGDGAKGRPVMKVTVHYAGGTTEEIVLRNGEEFADYIAPHDVPGSKRTSGVVTSNQLRYFSKPIAGRSMIETITLESFNNDVAPTTVAITAELAEAGAPPAAAAATGKPASGFKVLITGGGSSHDYEKWFHQADTVLLERGGLARVVYSDQPADFAGLLEGQDVLCQTANQAMPDPATRRAIADHVASGKGLVIVHAGLWYNWNDWPEYNRQLAGGGSRGHDRLGSFQVDVTAPGHPLMAGVPASFEIVDELYYFEPDAKGPPIEVLATAHSKAKDKTFPSVFVVKHPKARVVAITLGHDGRAHEHPAYQTLLRNAIQWAAGP